MNRIPRSRDVQVDKATQEAYYASRRPRRDKIVQVPSVDADMLDRDPKSRKTGPMRPVVVPFTPKPITWAQARKQGEAYGRVMIGHPYGAYPPADVLAEGKARNIRRADYKQSHVKPAPRFKKPAQGMWWLDKLADAVDRRVVITKPSYSRRNRTRKDPQPVATE